MLGIRRYLGAAIDLFQGEIARFVVDAAVPPTLAGLRSGDSQRARHVGLEVDANRETAAGLMQMVKAFLEGERAQPAVKRITFITSTAEMYRALQEELFKTFPDEAE